MQIDPKSPDTYLAKFEQIHEEHNKIQSDLEKSDENSGVDTLAFFESINQAQLDLTRSQKNIHIGVRKVEEKWSNTDTIPERHKTYISAIEFFKHTESTIGKVSNQMDKIIDQILTPPE
ncbi:hypothetical protein TVAG_300290 [Trichomonas vaginalis G3]|uniref:Uncharacterized protein n=1 Tax=Trichomonas vaginalis (strain ATCC PRA-98 / G3) TaxID=412133 RepID=A2FYK7_TRIV3|nr:hypothetical protein TVAGG3_0362970 [Trichomonas vaginalis G3]EAX90011.1 hypothetical protein TVAG_300290 [Trichomonas vaginalis G3]KAI5532071.1 hypothetical protein TVAGG3_0362970 [Trichomonas vaginalis G3]|eukprot:XP_001302941.1 hypothetical protein [Trichomonas vaginalis G3]